MQQRILAPFNPEKIGRTLSTPCVSSELITGLSAPEEVRYIIGMSIEDIANLAKAELSHMGGEIFNGEGWEIVPRERWRFIRPKLENMLRFTIPMQGGGGTARSIFGILAAVAIAAVAGPLGVALAPLVGIAEATATALIGAALTVGASYLGSVLFPPATGEQEAASRADQDARTLTQVETDQNIIARGGYLTTVFGKRRILLQEACQPRTYIKEGEINLDRTFVWKGKHTLTDPEGDGNRLSEFGTVVATQTRDGDDATPVEALVTKVAKTTAIQQELPSFDLDGAKLEDQATPANSEPREVQFALPFRKNMEEMAIRFTMTGLMYTGNDSSEVAIPLRLYFRLKGSSSWDAIGEIHITGREPGEIARDIRFRWDNKFNEQDGGSDIDGALTYRIFSRVPPCSYTVSDGETGDQFLADSYFRSSATTPLASTNIRSRRSGLRITLDETLFPKGEYEFKIQRGLIYSAASFDDSYTLSGNVPHFFKGRDLAGIWSVDVEQGAYPTRLTLNGAQVVQDDLPVYQPGTGVFDVRSKQTLKSVTAELEAHVETWNGSVWGSAGVTNNPAAHFRHVLKMIVARERLNTNLINSSILQDWYEECAAQDYRLSYVYTGGDQFETLRQIAAAGFARITNDAGKYGVDYFHDRSSQTPVMTFSPHNSRRIAFQKRVPEFPHSWRVKLANELNSYKVEEFTFASPFKRTYEGFESLELVNVSREIDAKRRILFDAYSRYHQDFVAVVDTSVEGHNLEKGSLVGVVTDIAGDFQYGARIREKISATQYRIDVPIPTPSEVEIYSQTNLYNLDNMYEAGMKQNIHITASDGPEMRTITNVVDDVITIASAFSTADDASLIGTHCTIGPEENGNFRMVVDEIDRSGDFGSTLTLVPEAHIIYEQMQKVA